MSEAVTHVSEKAPEVAEKSAAPRGRTRTCVGCSERIETGSPAGDDLVRLILGADGEIAIDPKGGGFGRGAYVHARRACVERAAKAGLLRATKGNARSLKQDEEGGEGERISADALARAIQRSMDRRIEGLLAAALRSRQLAKGANAVAGACQRGEAELVVVATDAAAAADLGEVRRAVAAGRAAAWGTKERLGRLLAPRPARSMLGPPQSPEGVGVIAITSRNIAEELSRTARMVAQLEAGSSGSAVKPARPAKPVTTGEPVKSAAPQENRRGPRRNAVNAPRRGGGRGVRAPAKDHRSDR
jgi:predicted RNA-binding protein YlxR (DUF448 family)